MRRLVRPQSGEAYQACAQKLSALNKKAPSWKALTSDDRAPLRRALEEMQTPEGGTVPRCAYCETPLKGHNLHIEHFVPRSKDKSKTFSWDNLFLSCNHKQNDPEHCGNYKKDALPSEAIKPDEDDPDQFFTIVPETGALQPLSDEVASRVKATTDLLNLYAPPLEDGRKVALKGYYSQIQELLKVAASLEEEGVGKEDIALLLNDEIEASITELLSAPDSAPFLGLTLSYLRSQRL